ncbi:hypothetical protein ACF068_15815 [Streptomyces sp. NPDC016309]|uniref:hypothetical protein n=1 Tax=Streptomyces sp. NPDC016309 TaxID=3364965 RepID=UPI0037009D34
MDVDKREPEGCLTAAVRIPVRIVVLLVVLPVRMVWDALTACGRALDRVVLRPLGRLLYVLFVTPLVWLYAYVLAPFGRGLAWLAGALVMYGLVKPARGLYRWVLAPVGHALVWLVDTLVVTPARGLYRWVLAPVGHALVWLVDTLVVTPARWLYRWVLTPLGHGVTWLARALFVRPWVALWRYVMVPVVRYGIVVPLGWLYRWVLAPVGRALVVVARELRDAVVVAWRVAGYLSRAVGRGLKWLGWNLLGRPVAWCYRNVCTPVGHALRDHLWRPVRAAVAGAGRATAAALASARETVRRARREAWRALVGGPSAGRAGEPAGVAARSLGSTTTAPGVAPAPEISPRQRG